jgi:hypothetical protein
MRPRIIVSPAEERNVTIDRRPPIKSREICTSSNRADVFPFLKILINAANRRAILNHAAENEYPRNDLHGSC